MKPLMLLLGVALAACGGKPKQNVESPEVTTRPTKKDGGEIRRVDKDPEQTRNDGRAATFAPLYFGYDVADLSSSARDELDRLAAYLRKNPRATVTISGHADERGTPEYNVALGDERARAARDYLVRLGIDAGRIRTFSHGEERPVVSGSDETSWAQNRRDELEVSLNESASAR